MFTLLCLPLTEVFYMFQMFCFSFQPQSSLQKRKPLEHFTYIILKRKTYLCSVNRPDFMAIAPISQCLNKP